MIKKKTLVVGASTNEERYSFLAVKKLSIHKHPVIAYGKQEGTIGSIIIVTSLTSENDIHTITLYVAAQHQPALYNSLLALAPKRIIFNPGTENKEFFEIANANGIEAIEACTLVMLSTGLY
jgi:predicted CoA-binding protein